MLKDIKKKGPWQGLWTLNANAYLGKGCEPKAGVILGFRLFPQLPPHKRQAAMGGK
jgi:hypothetical protein